VKQQGETAAQPPEGFPAAKLKGTDLKRQPRWLPFFFARALTPLPFIKLSPHAFFVQILIKFVSAAGAMVSWPAVGPARPGGQPQNCPDDQIKRHII
jgi:hypothetical protein